MTGALLYRGQVTTYTDEGEGVLRAWCEGKEIRVTPELEAAIEADRARIDSKHRGES